MQMKKRLMRTILMTAVFVFAGLCMMPVTAKANVTTGAIGSDGLSYTYDDSTKTLTITGSGSIDGNLYQSAYKDAEIVQFEDCTITGSMSEAFYGFHASTSLTNLKSVDFSGLDASGVTDMSAMFKYCANLESVDFSGLDASNVTDMSEMFRYCTNLESVDFSSVDASHVTDMSYMFYGCSNLESVDFSSVDASRLTNMYSMFRNCSNLTSVDFSGMKASQVTTTSYMFRACSSLTSVDLSGFETSQVTDMSLMFVYCSNLTSVDLSGFEDSVVTRILDVFKGCSSLVSLDISGLDFSSAPNTIEQGRVADLLEDCSNLETIKTPKAMDNDHAIELPDTFYDADLYESSGEYRTTNEITQSYVNTTLKRGSIDGWVTVDGVEYWYEDGVKQGTEGRGKEIYDPDSDAWYWLDVEQDGAKAVSKDVYQESNAGRYADLDDGTGKWVRYDENGKMVKGWQTTDAGTYYFDLETGTMAKGYTTVDGKEYYFNTTTGILESGGYEVPETGWLTIDGSDYWYEDYYRQGYSLRESYRGKEIFDSDSDAWCWLDNVQGGAKAVSKDVYQESDAGDWAESDDGTGKWVRYDAEGHMIKGWQTIDDGTYYFDYTYGTMAKGTVTIDGTTYYFDEATGILQ